jgi:uncharacterized membrane protein required for colicin V production
MWLDGLALALLALFAGLGARRGALASGLSLAAIAAGYGAAWLAATRLGGVVADALGTSPLLGAPIAGTAAFLFVSLDFAFVSWLLRRGREAAPSPGSRVGGALLGAARGALLALAIGLLALWFDAYQQLGPGADARVAAVETPLRAATRVAVAAGVEGALGADAPGAGLAARALTRPAETIERLRALAATPEIQALAQDAEFWSYVEADALPAALAQPSFQRLQWNGDRRRELAAVGLVDEITAGDPALFALELRGSLEQVGPRLRALREDPELAQLANDPAVADLLARRDVVGLLLHPRVRDLVARALHPSALAEKPRLGMARAGEGEPALAP